MRLFVFSKRTIWSANNSTKKSPYPTKNRPKRNRCKDLGTEKKNLIRIYKLWHSFHCIILYTKPYSPSVWLSISIIWMWGLCSPLWQSKPHWLCHSDTDCRAAPAAGDKNREKEEGGPSPLQPSRSLMPAAASCWALGAKTQCFELVSKICFLNSWNSSCLQHCNKTGHADPSSILNLLQVGKWGQRLCFGRHLYKKEFYCKLSFLFFSFNHLYLN